MSKLRPVAVLTLAICAATGPAPSVGQTTTTTAAPTTAPDLSGEVIPVAIPRTSLELAERFSKVVQFEQRVLRVDGFDPEVLHVTALSPHLIRIQGNAQGVTTVVVTDEQNRVFTVEVFVTGDARLLQSVLNRAFPNTSVTATKVQDSVLLRGWVTEPQQISQIVELAQLYFPRVLNQMKLGGAQEVQLRVKIMEVQRSKIRQFGFNFAYLGRNAAVVSQPGNVGTLSNFTLPFGGTPAAAFQDASLANPSLALGIMGDDFVFEGLLDALKEEGLLKIQAEPVLVTRSGEPARLVNGGEFPIPVPQSLGTVTIEWREFGVVLESLPTVISPTRIRQTIRAEVSERDFSTAVTLNGTTVPGLTKRTVETQAEMNFGETLVIGGLITTRRTSETDKLPFFGELPGIGAAFRNVRDTEAETELLVMITPEYVEAMPSDQVPPGGPGLGTDTPTDKELYWQGVIEIPKYGDHCEGCATNGLGSHSYPAMQGGYTVAPEGTSPATSPVLIPQPDVPPAPTLSPQLPPPGVTSKGTRPGAQSESVAGRSPNGQGVRRPPSAPATRQHTQVGHETPAQSNLSRYGLIEPAGGTAPQRR
jgi:pilus assembly protein CpaC